MKDPFEKSIERYLRRWRPTLRPLTIANKGYTLRRFVVYLREQHHDVQRFSQLRRQPHIEDWLEYILYMKAASRNASIRTLRLFFGDMIRWQWTEAPPPGLFSEEDLAPEENYLPRPLPPDIDQAVQKTFIEAGTFAAMALLLLRYTGLRIGEMRALPLHAMEPAGGDTFNLRVPIGKTHSERLIPLDDRTVELIQHIIAQRACRSKHPLPDRHRHRMMIDPFGRHLTQQSYSRIIHELTAHLNSAEHIYCHRLRHTFATEMARAGMPVPALMKLLGHTTPKMTMRYVDVAQTDLRQAYQQALGQLRVIRSVEARTLPAMPTHSTTLPDQPRSNQILKLMGIVIDYLESQRRDAHNPLHAQQLKRLIKRIRRADQDLKNIC